MIEIDGNVVYLGSCLDILPTLQENSIDSVITDPPYELGFMGKSWDSSGIAYDVDVWRECLRVLKPGGHLLAFGGSRTWHRLAMAIEDAGFEMRDSIAWIYGSGFPKSLDVSKAIDKAAGAEREVIGKNKPADLKDSVYFGNLEAAKKSGRAICYGEFDITAPATDEAKKWQGWGTALKPAFEPIVVARKPLIGTVAANVLAYGTGGLNIDGTRISIKDVWQPSTHKANDSIGTFKAGERITKQHSDGRWPSNVMLDEFTAALVDEQSGFSKSSGVINRWTDGAKPFGNGAGGAYESVQGVADSGGASRFFYVSKASKRDRNEGLDELLKNFHPTVKPIKLMQYLVKLVTPEGGIVLDPFTGSGSTGKAAIIEGFKFIGCELTEDYQPIIKGRLQHAADTRAEILKEAEREKEEVLF